MIPTTPEESVKFIQTCEGLALIFDFTSCAEPYIDYYLVDLVIRCQLDVEIARPARFISRYASLTIAWAKHLSDQSICGGLRYSNFYKAEIALD